MGLMTTGEAMGRGRRPPGGGPAAAGALFVAALVAAVAASPAARAQVQAQDGNAFKLGDSQATTPDLCAPCRLGSQCFSGVCTQDANNTGDTVCTQYCNKTDNLCPQGFSCQQPTGQPQTICVPDGNSVCAERFVGAQTNMLCRQTAAISGASADLIRSCVAGDVCFKLLPNFTGVCTQQCSRVDADVQCDTGYSCCYGQEADGSCGAAAANEPNGGCFLIRQPGQSCVVGNQSICAAGSTCLSPTDDPALAVCYRACASASDCIASEVCATLGAQVCCERASFDGVNAATCRPASGTCLRQVGVACDVNEQCTSGLCFKSADGGVCSQVCATSDDCPGPQADVNGDGVADGGSTCTAQPANRMLCLPNGAIAAPPSCATATSLMPQATGESEPAGVGCAQADGLGGAVGACLVALWRRRRAAGADA